MPIKSKHKQPLSVKILRWVARIWSLLSLANILLLIYGTDATQTIKDWPLFALWGVAIFGLLVAWKWELPGAIIALSFVALHDLIYLLVKGTWLPSFMIFWALIVPSAILFLIVWLIVKKIRLKKKHKLSKSG